MELWVYMPECNVWSPHRVYFGWLGYARLRSAFSCWRRIYGNADAMSKEKERAGLVLAQFIGTHG